MEELSIKQKLRVCNIIMDMLCDITKTLFLCTLTKDAITIVTKVRRYYIDIEVVFPEMHNMIRYHINTHSDKHYIISAHNNIKFIRGYKVKAITNPNKLYRHKVVSKVKEELLTKYLDNEDNKINKETKD